MPVTCDVTYDYFGPYILIVSNFKFGSYPVDALIPLEPLYICPSVSCSFCLWCVRVLQRWSLPLDHDRCPRLQPEKHASPVLITLFPKLWVNALIILLGIFHVFYVYILVEPRVCYKLWQATVAAYKIQQVSLMCCTSICRIHIQPPRIAR